MPARVWLWGLVPLSIAALWANPRLDSLGTLEQAITCDQFKTPPQRRVGHRQRRFALLRAARRALQLSLREGHNHYWHGGLRRSSPIECTQQSLRVTDDNPHNQQARAAALLRPLVTRSGYSSRPRSDLGKVNIAKKSSHPASSANWMDTWVSRVRDFPITGHRPNATGKRGAAYRTNSYCSGWGRSGDRPLKPTGHAQCELVPSRTAVETPCLRCARARQSTQ